MPEWAKNVVFYQIYPQTFCDSDGDGIGDIQGIISKLDYVKNDLKDVLRFWMDMGCDGFRADMAGALVKTRQTRGNEQFFTTNENATKLFWREIRELLEKEYPGSLMVAELSYPSDALDKCFHVDFFHWFNGYNDLFQKESWRILNGCCKMQPSELSLG